MCYLRMLIDGITRVLDKHIHPAHTFYDVMLQMTKYALNEKHNEYARMTHHFDL